MGWFIALALLATHAGSFYAGNKYGTRLVSGLRRVKGAF